jgi:hypothetical protein
MGRSSFSGGGLIAGASAGTTVMKYEPKSQNPQPEPHEDVTRSFQWRFRDPNFVTIWQRWQVARAAWEKAWWKVVMGEGGPDNVYDPDPTLMPKSPEAVRLAAQEFIEARRAYIQEINRRDQE